MTFKDREGVGARRGAGPGPRWGGRSSRLLPAVLLGVAVAGPAAAEPVRLRLRYEPGERFRQAATLRQVQTPVMPGEQAPDAARATSVEAEVTAEGAVAKGVVRDTLAVSLRYTRLRMGLKTPQKSVAYDTGRREAAVEPDAESLRGALDRAVGQTVVLTLDAQGRVTDVEAPPGLLGAAGSPGGGLVDNPLGGLPGLLPDRPVQRGDRWTNAVPLDLPLAQGKFPLTLTLATELAAIEGEGAARVALLTSAIALVPRAAGAGGAPADLPGAAPAPSPYTLDGSGTARTRFGLEDGKARRTEATLDLVVRPRPGTLGSGPKDIRVRQEFDIVVEPLAGEPR